MIIKLIIIIKFNILFIINVNKLYNNNTIINKNNARKLNIFIINFKLIIEKNILITTKRGTLYIRGNFDINFLISDLEYSNKNINKDKTDIYINNMNMLINKIKFVMFI